eukprot:119152-Lingulodinium_polyedra.AAC.1
MPHRLLGAAFASRGMGTHSRAHAGLRGRARSGPRPGAVLDLGGTNGLGNRGGSRGVFLEATPLAAACFTR